MSWALCNSPCWCKMTQGTLNKLQFCVACIPASISSWIRLSVANAVFLSHSYCKLLFSSYYLFQLDHHAASAAKGEISTVPRNILAWSQNSLTPISSMKVTKWFTCQFDHLSPYSHHYYNTIIIISHYLLLGSKEYDKIEEINTHVGGWVSLFMAK